tara:strand:+ start:337 stop:879 length:543 start_codon:yes stop_codon:yes gene_type:complete
MIIGAGGIGSFIIPLLNKVGLFEVTVYDHDIVETKNLSYQNFRKEEVTINKALCMAERYNTVLAEPYKVLSEQQLEGYDLVICCADNLDVRRTMYNSEIKWLDLRAQGRNGLLISSDENPKLYSTLTSGPEGNFSCQGDVWDRSMSGVHFTHVAVAGYGAEWVMRHFNGEDTHKHIQVRA